MFRSWLKLKARNRNRIIKLKQNYVKNARKFLIIPEALIPEKQAKIDTKPNQSIETTNTSDVMDKVKLKVVNTNTCSDSSWYILFE